ncbi:MAG TPA: hypothetical protein VML55_14985 [Planctomycetaceae bacterium]|nr:hypothetical protein [Planctomycetaceae bacterium]
MSETSATLQTLFGREVVLDLASPYVILGMLADADHRYLILSDADVHDLRDTATTREVYVLKSRRHGINPNRQRVLVRRDEVVSLSALEDVVE